MNKGKNLLWLHMDNSQSHFIQVSLSPVTPQEIIIDWILSISRRSHVVHNEDHIFFWNILCGNFHVLALAPYPVNSLNKLLKPARIDYLPNESHKIILIYIIIMTIFCLKIINYLIKNLPFT